MSYVPLSDVGCVEPESPWAYFPQGTTTMFMFPQTLATSGKTTNLSNATASEEGQAFFAEQVRLGGWHDACEDLFHTEYSQSYPGMFLPEKWNVGMHINHSQQWENYNMGQMFLNNAMCWTFLKWSPTAFTHVPFNRNEPSSMYVPSFTDPVADPLGIQNKQYILKPVGESKRYGRMMAHAINQAISSWDGFGCCGKCLRFICTMLDRENPGWGAHNPDLGKWWSMKRELSKTMARAQLIADLNEPA